MATSSGPGAAKRALEYAANFTVTAGFIAFVMSNTVQVGADASRSPSAARGTHGGPLAGVARGGAPGGAARGPPSPPPPRPQLSQVRGPSMLPTLHDGDICVTERVSSSLLGSRVARALLGGDGARLWER